MRIVLGIHSLAGSGGTESYVTTVGDHLQRTGHDVYVYSETDGHTGDEARSLGLRVVIGAQNLPREIDVALVQDTVAAMHLLDSHPATPQIYNWHSEMFDLQVPPQINDVTKLIVVLHADALRRVKSMAVKPPVVQLRHPVDILRFRPLEELNKRPRRLVALGNYLHGEPAATLSTACEIAGIEFRHVGFHGEGITSQPELAMNDGDIVVGKAKVAIEGMSCGRAVYVYDAYGSDGWVTKESYPVMEANCFAGRTVMRQLSAEQLAAELLEYTPRMGQQNRDLAIDNHSAMTHTGLLVESIEGVLGDSPTVAPNDNAFELARMTRVSWRHEGQAFALGNRLNEASRQQKWTESELERARGELEYERARADAAAAAHESVVSSKRWLLTQRVLSRFDRLRGRA